MGKLLHKSSMKTVNQSKSAQYTLLYLQVDVHRVEKENTTTSNPKQKSKKRRTDKVEGHGESTHEDKVNEVSSDEKCSVVWLIKLVRKQFKCFFF